MALIDEWVEIDDPDTRRAFLLRNLHLISSINEAAGEVTLEIKNQANRLLNTDRRLKALELAESLMYVGVVLPQEEKRTRGLAKARSLMVRANYLRRNGEYDRAALDYGEAQRLCLENNSPVEAIRCRMVQIDVLANLGQFDEAFKISQETIRQAEATGNKQLLADVLSNVGALYFHRDDYQGALGIYARQLYILEELGEAGKNTLANCYGDLALNYLFLHRYQEALEMAEKMKEVSQELGQDLWIAHAEKIKADALFSQGHFTAALRTWDSALTLFKKQNVPKEAHLVNHWRSICMGQLNRLEEALELCQELIEEACTCNWVKNQAVMIHWKAILQARLELYEESLESYKEAVELFRTLDSPDWLVRLYLDQSELLVKMGEYEEARQVLALAEQEFPRHNIVRWRAQLRLDQARIALAENQLAEAGRLGREALKDARSYDMATLNYQIYLLLGQVAEDIEDYSKAFEHYREATAQIERLRGAVTLEMRGDFLRDKMEAYEAIVQVALNRAEIEQAYDYIERSKSRALTEMLANQVDLQVKARSEGDVPLVEQLRQLRQEHAYYYGLLSQSDELVSSLRGAVAEEELSPELVEARTELRKREKQIEQILMQLQVRNAAYTEELSLLEVSSESPQPWLDEQTLLVEYYFARDEVLAMAISKNEKRVFRYLVSPARLQRSIDTLALSLQSLKPHLAAKFLANTRAQLSQLHKVLFAPLCEFAAGFRHLIIVPHGPLHYLPFHALWNGETGRYLVEDFEISYLPAASQLQFYRKRAGEFRQTQNLSRSLVMAYSGSNNLPFVLEEAREVANCLGENPYLETEARSEVFDETEACYRIIHMATHGQFRADAPLFSFVELADGRLLTADLFNLKLNAALMTLSACESGLNVVTGGDELVGLSRACLYAGAASLLLSLWRVEDRSTASLMKDFYQRLGKPGMTRAAALRQAQLALLRGELSPENPVAYQHPYFWAPFFLIGEAGTL